MQKNNEQTTYFNAWILASRPRTLPAAAAPVFVAVAAAWHDGVFHLPSALACLFISLLMQIGANFANDLFDHERGTDTPARIGPTRVTASGLVQPREMRIGIAVVFSLAGSLGLYLTWLHGWQIIVLGLLIIIAALAYTGGPFPYGYYALGDLFVFLSFGVAAVCGTYYSQAGSINSFALLASIPVGLLIVNILVVNNTRDIITDREAKKRTLAVFFGRNAMLIEYLLCEAIAFIVPIVLWYLGLTSKGVMLSWVSLPQAILLFREFSRTTGRELNKTLAGTAQLALFYSILFSIGIAFKP